MKQNFYEAKRRLSNNRQKNSAKNFLEYKIEEHIKTENSHKEKIRRLTYEQREWIRIRDEWSCQLKLNGCRENTKIPVQIHHIVPWDYAYYRLGWPKEWIDSPENTITLCYVCHAMIHAKNVNIDIIDMNKTEYAFLAEQFPLEDTCWLTDFDRQLRETAILRTNDYITEHPNDPFPLPT